MHSFNANKVPGKEHHAVHILAADEILVLKIFETLILSAPEYFV